jgi:hypothetical protein
MIVFQRGELVNDLEIAIIIDGGNVIEVIELQALGIPEKGGYRKKGIVPEEEAVLPTFLKAAREFLLNPGGYFFNREG